MLYSPWVFQANQGGIYFMGSQTDQHNGKGAHHSLIYICGVLLLLFLFSVLLVACGAGGTTSTQANPINPAVTVTIHLGGASGTQLPTLPGYTCGAWATNSSPMYNGNIPVSIYAKYTQNVDGNPQGVGGATATATMYWGDGTVDTLTQTTSADGLAFFSFPTAGKAAAINRTSLVTVGFAKDGTPGCTVDRDRAAFFTLTAGGPAATAATTATTTAGPQPPGKKKKR